MIYYTSRIKPYFEGGPKNLTTLLKQRSGKDFDFELAYNEIKKASSDFRKENKQAILLDEKVKELIVSFMLPDALEYMNLGDQFEIKKLVSPLDKSFKIGDYLSFSDYDAEKDVVTLRCCNGYRIAGVFRLSMKDFKEAIGVGVVSDSSSVEQDEIDLIYPVGTYVSWQEYHDEDNEIFYGKIVSHTIEMEEDVFAIMDGVFSLPVTHKVIMTGYDFLEADLSEITEDYYNAKLKEFTLKAFGSETPTTNNTEKELHELYLDKFRAGEKINRSHIEKIAKSVGITDIDLAYEKCELAWVLQYREIIDSLKGETPKTILDAIWKWYSDFQPTYNQRSSVRKELQQYSTSAPISYLAGVFIGKDVQTVFEPSAGNGLLTIAIPYYKLTVNEMDTVRVENLRKQPFERVMEQNGALDFNMPNRFDAILSNPPFGILPDVEYGFGGYPFRKLDCVMIAHALNTMKDNGRAALIMGGHTLFDKKGAIGTHRLFFNWLFHHYHVLDVININSEKLYHRQGTVYPLRLILIAGRKTEPEGFAPVKSSPMGELIMKTANDYEELYQRIMSAKNKADKPILSRSDIIRLESFKLKIALKE